MPIVIETPRFGSSADLRKYAGNAKFEALKCDTTVSFNFNGIFFCIDGASDIDTVIEHYQSRISGEVITGKNC